MLACRCIPAMPVSLTLPLLPWLKLFENARSKPEAGPGQRPSLHTTRLYASTSGPFTEGVLPLAAASGGYNGRGNPGSGIIGPPLYGVEYHSLIFISSFGLPPDRDELPRSEVDLFPTQVTRHRVGHVELDLSEMHDCP